MLNKSTVAVLLGIALGSFAVADEAQQTAPNEANSSTTAKCSSDKCDSAECAKSQCATAKCTTKCSGTACAASACKDKTEVTAQVASTKTKCATCCEAGCTKTITVSAEQAACQVAQCDKGQCDKGQCDKGQCDKGQCDKAKCGNGECGQSTVGLPKGAKCVVKAVIHGEFQGANEKTLRLVVSVPGAERGVPVLSSIPYCKRLFKNAGTSSKVVVLHIPRENVELIAPRANSSCAESCAPVIDATTKTAKSVSAPKQCPFLSSVCEQEHVAKTPLGVYTFSMCGRKDGNSNKDHTVSVPPTPAYSDPGRAPMHPAPPMAILPPAHYGQVSAYPAPQYSAYAAPGCNCGASCRCSGKEKLADVSKLLHRLTTISAENAWLKAHTQARHEVSKKHEVLQQQLHETQLECTRLEAIQAQREKLFEEMFEVSVHNARLQAHVEMMEEREGLRAEIAALQQAQPDSTTHERVNSLAVELDRSRSENAILRAKIVELEAKVNAISERVATQPTQVR